MPCPLMEILRVYFLSSLGVMEGGGVTLWPGGEDPSGTVGVSHRQGRDREPGTQESSVG